MKKLLLGSLIAISSFGATQAASISGSTDFRVTLPEILILYHWDDAHLTLNAEHATTPGNDSDSHEISDATAHDVTANLGATSYNITGDVATTGHEASGFGTVKVTLQNSWAVRSISSGEVTLALTNPNGTLKSTDPTAATTDVIKTSNAVLLSTAPTGATVKLPAKWEPTMGSIQFDLDLSKATKPGEYNTRGVAGEATTADEATDTFLLTLTGN